MIRVDIWLNHDLIPARDESTSQISINEKVGLFMQFILLNILNDLGSAIDLKLNLIVSAVFVNGTEWVIEHLKT